MTDAERPGQSRSPGARAWRAHALALATYTACALAVTFPLVTRMGDALVANEFGQVDGFLSIWNVWWAATALRAGADPFHTPLLFYPQGLDLFWLWLSFPNGLLAAPLTYAFGPLPAYNALILAGYVLGGYAAFLFIRRFCDDGLAALVGGATYTLTAFHMRRVLDGVLDTASIQWVPLYVLALHALLARPRWWLALACGALALVVGLGSWYYGLFCLMYTAMAALVWAARGGAGVRGRGAGPLNWRVLLWGLAPIAVWLALVAPQLLELVQNGDRQFGVGLHANQSNSADLVAFFLPNPFHPLWGAAVSEFYTRLHPEAWLWQIAFGWVALALGAAGLVGRWRALWPWALLLLLTMLIAMGERLMVWGADTGVPLPYALIAGLPGIRTSHRPNHITLISALLLGLLAAHGAAALLRRAARARGLLAAGLVACVLFVDGWAGPLPLYSLPIPAGYAQLSSPDGGAILPIPVNLNVARSEQLWYQTAHGWPIIGGYTGREPPYPLGKYAPGVRELRYGRVEQGDIVTPGWPASALAMLQALNIRYVAFHPDLMKASLERERQVIAQMGLSPSYSDGRLELYPVPAGARRVVAYLGGGWGGLEHDGQRRWRWMSDQPAELYLYNPHGQPWPVALSLRLEAFERQRPLAIGLDGAAPATIDVSRAEMRRTVRLLLPPGEHVVYFSAPADPVPEQPALLRSVVFLGIGVQ